MRSVCDEMWPRAGCLGPRTARLQASPPVVSGQGAGTHRRRNRARRANRGAAATGRLPPNRRPQPGGTQGNGKSPGAVSVSGLFHLCCSSSSRRKDLTLRPLCCVMSRARVVRARPRSYQRPTFQTPLSRAGCPLDKSPRSYRVRRPRSRQQSSSSCSDDCILRSTASPL